ncbi:hypothetical protein LEMLEM_LOCUS25503 [Lemmus lemmus]
MEPPLQLPSQITSSWSRVTNFCEGGIEEMAGVSGEDLMGPPTPLREKKSYGDHQNWD